jgi:hypothetical protein
MGLASWFSNLWEGEGEWKTVQIWSAKENACDKCQALNGTVIPDGADIDSLRPHPNCKCEAKEAREGFEFGEWKRIGTGQTLGYEYTVFSSRITGAAFSVRWSRKYAIVEERTKTKVRICEGERTVLEDRKETNKRYEYEVRWNGGICRVGGGDPSQCEYYLITNPWTGETIRYSPPAGP